MNKIDVVSIMITVFSTILLVNVIMYSISMDSIWLIREIKVCIFVGLFVAAMNIVKYFLKRKP